MTKAQKVGVAVFTIVIGFGIIASFLQSRELSSKLVQCSNYTVANITRVYRLRGMAHVVYQYRIGLNKVESDKSVNTNDTDESWMVDLNKLRKRRLLVQVYCINKSAHQIVWNAIVPDTLRYIPSNGWKQNPFVVKATN